MKKIVKILGICLSIWVGCATLVQAQDFPSKPVKLIVPFPPGGGTDILARPIAQKLSEKWGQTVIVENRGGAGGNIGTKAAADAPADGYTLILGTVGTHAVNQSLYVSAGFDSTIDFAAITMVANTTNILVVHPSVPAQTMAELLAYARANPNKLNYASPGNGSPSHLATEIFKSMAGVELVHVPYKGSGPALADMLGGQIQFWIANSPVVLQHIETGKLRALASTSAKRPAVAANIPTIDEAGLKGYEADTWFGIFAPAKTPKAVLAQLNQDIVAVLNLPDVRQKFSAEGAEIVADSSASFTQRLHADIAKWKKVIVDLKLRVE
ncbi:MAG: tripartite tricarboxylate transporter substrate binding protein [Alcaligenaceae bacterium]